jgi:general nucleoside transport system permease protein
MSPWTRSRARSRLIAMGAALGIAVLYATLASATPRAALEAFFLSPFTNRYSFFALLENAAPLLACALGASIAFRAGAFNLGGEGQASAGTLAAAIAAQAASALALPPAIGIAAAIVAGALAGAALAFSSAALERGMGAPVMLTSFLLSQATLIAVDWAISGPLRDPTSNLLGMPPIARAYLLPRLAPPSPLSLALPIALVAAVLTVLVTKGSRVGMELRFLGKSSAFARAIGLSPRLGAWAMTSSGALAGAAGSFLVLGQAGRAVKGMTGGVGWNGLSAALIGGSDGVFALPASLFLSWLDSGSRQSSILADLSPDASSVLVAVALFLITARFSKDKA